MYMRVCVYVFVRAPVCVCVCVCVTMKKKVPDEWQARQATLAILQVSSSKHNAKKITTRVRDLCACVCVCVCQRKTKIELTARATESAISQGRIRTCTYGVCVGVRVCVRACVCVRER